MTTLTVWKFNSASGAEDALAQLSDRQKEYVIDIQDAAIVSWKQGKKKPKTKQAVNLVASESLDGAFWGLLFGLIFFVPIFGMLVGGLAGALSGSLADYGIDDTFIKSVRAKVTEGTSALFLLTGQVTFDKVEDIFKASNAELVQSNLTKEQEDKLKEHFSAE
jgi:uncharacterized membrane protein